MPNKKYMIVFYIIYLFILSLKNQINTKKPKSLQYIKDVG